MSYLAFPLLVALYVAGLAASKHHPLAARTVTVFNGLLLAGITTIVAAPANPWGTLLFGVVLAPVWIAALFATVYAGRNWMRFTEGTLQPAVPDASLRGLGGWLKILAAGLIVLPLLNLASVASAPGTAVWSSPPGVAQMALHIAMALASVFVGYRLWQLDPRAPQWVRVYLLANLGTALLSVGLAYLRVGSARPVVFVGAAAVALAFQAAFAWCIFAYLRESARVKATFATLDQIVAPPPARAPR